MELGGELELIAGALSVVPASASLEPAHAAIVHLRSYVSNGQVVESIIAEVRLIECSTKRAYLSNFDGILSKDLGVAGRRDALEDAILPGISLL